jgi:hypothetical protein
MRSKVSKLVETCRQAEKWPKGPKRQKSFCGFADVSFDLAALLMVNPACKASMNQFLRGESICLGIRLRIQDGILQRRDVTCARKGHSRGFFFGLARVAM